MAKPTAVVEQERPGVARVVDPSLSPLAFYQMRSAGLKRELAAAEARGVAHLRKGTVIEVEALDVAIALVDALDRAEDFVTAYLGERYDRAAAEFRDHMVSLIIRAKGGAE